MYKEKINWRSGGAEWEFETYLVKFETYLVKFETYSVIRDYETKKTAGASEPPEPPMMIYHGRNKRGSNFAQQINEGVRLLTLIGEIMSIRTP